MSMVCSDGSETISYDYYAKVEKRKAEDSGKKSVTRIVLVGTLQDWRKEQVKDPSISLQRSGRSRIARPVRK